MMSPPSNWLLGKWRHAQEEASHGVMIYYAEGYPLPTVRGRAGMIFKPNGEFIKQVIAPACGLEEISGTWQWQPQGNVLIQLPGEPRGIELAIIALTEQRLCIGAVRSLLYRF